MEFIKGLFDPTGFVARWHCGTWDGGLGWLLIASDLAIAAAYLAIPTALAVLWYRRRDVPYPGVLWLFVLFIVSCGATHLIDAVLFYDPVYRLSALAKALTAAVSVTTAIVLVRSMPGLLRLPSIVQQNAELQAISARERALLIALDEARGMVEKRNADLLVRWKTLTNSLAAARAVAVRWNAATNEVDWHLGLEESLAGLGIGLPSFSHWSGVLSPASAEQLREEAARSHRTGSRMSFEAPMMDRADVRVRLSAMPEPDSKGEPLYFNGVFRLFVTSPSATTDPLAV